MKFNESLAQSEVREIKKGQPGLKINSGKTAEDIFAMGMFFPLKHGGVWKSKYVDYMKLMIRLKSQGISPIEGSPGEWFYKKVSDAFSKSNDINDLVTELEKIQKQFNEKYFPEV